MDKYQRDVHEFMAAVGQLDHEPFSGDEYPVPLSPEVRELRQKLIEEEAAELIAAIEEGDFAHIIKEACDLQYVLSGLMNTIGVVQAEYWDIVHDSNMLKTTGPIAPNGKRLKPEGWVPVEPLIQARIDEQR